MKIKLLILSAFCTFNVFSQTNLVPNGGFETWTNNNITLSDWTVENDVTQNTSVFTEGSKSVKLALSYSIKKPKITAQVPMVAGKTYTIKFKYRYGGSNYNTQHPIALNISKDGSATTLSSSTFAANNNWTIKETTFTPDQNMSYDLSISLATFDDAAFYVFIDAVQVYLEGTEQYTLIPDVNFENKLIALGIETGAADGKILTNDVNKLLYLNVSSSSIADFTGLQDFVSLTKFDCSHNPFTTLDITKNVALTDFTCLYNELTSLDLSKNVALKTFSCYENKIESLDLSNNLALTDLTCSYNKLSTLDVSQNTALKTLSCFSNQLTTLDVSKNVSLTSLTCSNNKLTSLDVSKNPALLNLDCGYNQLTNLDVSKNQALITFSCGTNKLTNLDVSKNAALTSLGCYNNELTTIDVSKNTALVYFHCRENQFTDLDVSKNVALKTLHCYNNKIAVLDISKNIALKDFNCSGNQLKALDVSNNTSLTYLYCQSNQLTDLDVSKNTKITELNCYNNRLSNLNLKNGNNSSFDMRYCSFYSNQYLSCIQVDNAEYSNDYWTTAKDRLATYNTYCEPYTLIPDWNFEQKLIALGIDTDGLFGVTSVVKLNAVTTLDVSNSDITDLSGIEFFTNLTSLDCSNNKISTLDVSKNVLLQTLDASSNKLTVLDLSNNPNLTVIYVVSNPLKSLNVQNGNNANFVLPSESAKKTSAAFTSFLQNSDLGCIKVDNAGYSNASWSKIKETTTTYSETCTTLGIEDSVLNDVVVYPNPTKAVLNIKNVTLEKAAVYNLLGQLVESFNLNTADLDHTIDLSALPKGMYYVYLINQNSASAKKVIVE